MDEQDTGHRGNVAGNPVASAAPGPDLDRMPSLVAFA